MNLARTVHVGYTDHHHRTGAIEVFVKHTALFGDLLSDNKLAHCLMAMLMWHHCSSAERRRTGAGSGGYLHCTAAALQVLPLPGQQSGENCTVNPKSKFPRSACVYVSVCLRVFLSVSLPVCTYACACVRYTAAADDIPPCACVRPYVLACMRTHSDRSNPLGPFHLFRKICLAHLQES